MSIRDSRFQGVAICKKRAMILLYVALCGVAYWFGAASSGVFGKLLDFEPRGSVSCLPDTQLCLGVNYHEVERDSVALRKLGGVIGSVCTDSIGSTSVRARGLLRSIVERCEKKMVIINFQDSHYFTSIAISNGEVVFIFRSPRTVFDA